MQSENDKALTKGEIKSFHHRMKLNAPSIHVPVIIQTVENISQQLSAVPKVPSEFELDLTYQVFLEAIKTNQWNDITNRDWKFVPYVFWYSNVKLGANKEFVSKYFNWLHKQSLKSNWRRLIYVYLRDFNFRLEHPATFKTTANAIQKAFKQPDLKFGLEVWGSRHSKASLFNDNFDLSKAVKLFIDSKYDWEKFIDVTGLDRELSTAGYADAIGIELLKQLTFSAKVELIEAVQFFHFTDHQLRFADRRVDVIQTLLSPWKNNPNFQNEEVREKIQNLLLKHFKDPRMPNNLQNGWRLVDDDSIRLFFKWMTKASLEQFFSIIDSMALEHQWKYRRAFWKAYYDKEVLDDAWVAFGPDARYYARRLFGPNFSAGDLEGVNQSNQSVLIVRIKDLVFAEWSHNGRCRAWKSSDRLCPSTYKAKYYGVHLKEKSMKIVPSYQQDGISHQYSENYSWQRKLADFIFDETGIRMQNSDFWIEEEKK